MRQTPWAPVVVMLAYTPAALVMFPRPVLTLLTVIAFGPWLGFAYGMGGILIAAMATYYAGRLLRPQTVERLAGENLESVSKALRRHGVLAVFAVRIVPAAPFAIEGMVAGGLRIKPWHYAVGTFLGMLPGVLATSVFGDQIAGALEDPAKVSFFVIGAAVVALAAVLYFARRWALKQR